MHSSVRQQDFNFMRAMERSKMEHDNNVKLRDADEDKDFCRIPPRISKMNSKMAQMDYLKKKKASWWKFDWQFPVSDNKRTPQLCKIFYK